MTYLFLALGLCFVFIFVSKRTAKVTLHVAFLKAVASVFFILTGLFAMVENEACPKIIGALVATGGVWGLLGDIALDLKYVFKKYEKEYLMAGFSSFGVGHVFYIIAIVILFGFNKFAFIGAAAITAFCVSFVFIAEKIMKLQYGKFKSISVYYIIVLGFVFGLSVMYSILNFSVVSLMLAIGFTLFLLSDVVLSGLYFGATEKERTSRPSIIINHLLYYSAQFIIASSLLFIKG